MNNKSINRGQATQRVLLGAQILTILEEKYNLTDLQLKDLLDEAMEAIKPQFAAVGRQQNFELMSVVLNELMEFEEETQEEEETDCPYCKLIKEKGLSGTCALCGETHVVVPSEEPREKPEEETEVCAVCEAMKSFHLGLQGEYCPACGHLFTDADYEEDEDDGIKLEHVNGFEGIDPISEIAKKSLESERRFQDHKRNQGLGQFTQEDLNNLNFGGGKVVELTPEMLGQLFGGQQTLGGSTCPNHKMRQEHPRAMSLGDVLSKVQDDPRIKNYLAGLTEEEKNELRKLGLLK